MGIFMKEHDIYVGSLQEKLNLRFAPSLGTKELHGGLDEMVELQKEFEIFKLGRSFATSIAALNLTGLSNAETKNRFQRYLTSLRKVKSNVATKSGDAAIVDALIRNLAAKKPLPVYFELHDLNASKEAGRVLITERGRPLFYMKQDYLVVSLPLGLDSKAK
ncbi:hypothetical protein [Polaromonas sp. YR568]|uniref:hypothetical protein n=1 Tax=Polaromonas sp. YR568 TaxID=1855301 RepID=UPI003137DEEF